jgi:hypothetical protein
LQLPLLEDDTIPVNLVLYPVQERAETLQDSVQVHNNGTLYDVLISLAKVLHSDQWQEPNDEENAEKVSSLKEPLNEVEKIKLIEAYAQRAQNMAVIDMRECYIF